MGFVNSLYLFSYSKIPILIPTTLFAFFFLRGLRLTATQVGKHSNVRLEFSHQRFAIYRVLLQVLYPSRNSLGFLKSFAGGFVAITQRFTTLQSSSTARKEVYILGSQISRLLCWQNMRVWIGGSYSKCAGGSGTTSSTDMMLIEGNFAFLQCAVSLRLKPLSP
jgi:hypothetical protein